MIRYTLIFSAVLLLSSCGKINPPGPRLFKSSDLPLEDIKLPEGFEIELFAAGVKNARSMALSPKGTLFVGTRGEGKVYALRDKDGDAKADELFVLAEGLKMPNGVALHNGDLYVAEVSRILRFPNIEGNLSEPGEPEVVFDQYPTETHHGWKYIAFGPDGKLYVPVGAPCNICKSEDEVFASITRMNPDGTGMEVVQHGIRNTVGFTWHPKTGELWFTDNGRDWMGDDEPYCELNRAPEDGMHFGYPYCHQGDLPDPEFGSQRDCSEFTPPAKQLGPHVAPLGLEFYTQHQFPEAFRQLYVAEHGSWNRSKKIGYRVMMAVMEGDEVKAYQPFAEGWLKDGEVWGRPVDVEMMPDGSMLVSDDFADAIYRIRYAGEAVR
ncbi:PQQ-dependent sugar dehydrogenase [Phaeodactylibacter luteus]|uniref:Sorbosone dehydrogenase family protein n=1 Tax=Phaeodactylibacter luteus TaxID=1564516 RepID=A0A5C6RKG5_9BACT|nr:sorbosone dehydrogenase family protein [Phaeodactylibacter luteus]TXB62901.1 sorbosone dehydrogenase family protein [Phaeodactylibacter luteus]